METSKSTQPPWYLRDDVVVAREVGAGLKCGGYRLALGEDEDSHRLPHAVREHRDAPDLLVRVAGVRAGPQVELDGLVERRRGRLLDQGDGLFRLVFATLFKQGLGLSVPLASNCHESVLGSGYAPRSTVMPMLLAVPSTILMAASMSMAFRSFIFCSAISFTLEAGTEPTFSAWGSLLPFSMPAACLSRAPAGGVLSSKENGPVFVNGQRHRHDVASL